MSKEERHSRVKVNYQILISATLWLGQHMQTQCGDKLGMLKHWLSQLNQSIYIFVKQIILYKQYSLCEENCIVIVGWWSVIQCKWINIYFCFFSCIWVSCKWLWILILKTILSNFCFAIYLHFRTWFWWNSITHKACFNNAFID